MTISTLIGSIQTLFMHLLAVILLLSAFLQMGYWCRRLLNVSAPNASNKTILQFSLDTVFGIIAFQIISTLSLYYCDLTLAKFLTRSWLYGILLSFFWRVAVETRVFQRAIGRYGVLSAVAFLMFYSPFLKFSEPFLASSGSGDHTIYLGAARLSEKFNTDPEIRRPRFRPFLDRMAISNRMAISEGTRTLFGFIDKDKIETASQYDLFEISSARRVILNGWDAAWWALPFCVIGLKPLFAQLTAYMALLFTLLVTCANLIYSVGTIWDKGRRWSIGGFALLTLSAAFSSIAFNHYYLQLLNITVILGLFVYLLNRIQTGTCRWRADLAVFCLSGLASVGFYWATLPWYGAVLVGYAVIKLGVRPSAQSELTVTEKITQIAILFILLLFFLPSIIFTLKMGYSFAFQQIFNSQADAESATIYLGQRFEKPVNLIGAIFGIHSFWHLQPFTSKEATDLVLQQHRTMMFLMVSGFALLFLTGIPVLWKGRAKSAFENKNLPLAFGFSIIASGIMIVMTVLSARYRYTFTKAALNTLPFLIVFSLAGMCFMLKGLKGRPQKLVSGAIGVFFGIWILALAQIKGWQIEKFWNGTDRASAIYGLRVVDEAKLPKDIHTFYFPQNNTDFSLLETILTNLRAVPASQYFLPTYLKILASTNVPLSRFVVPDPKTDNYKVTQFTDFFVSDKVSTGVALIPFSPYLDIARSTIPERMFLDRINFLEYYVYATADFELISLTDPSKFSVKALPLVAGHAMPIIKVSKLDQAPASMGPVVGQLPGHAFQRIQVSARKSGEQFVLRLEGILASQVLLPSDIAMR